MNAPAQRVLFVAPIGPGLRRFSDPVAFAAYVRCAAECHAVTGWNGPHTFVIVLEAAA